MKRIYLICPAMQKNFIDKHCINCGKLMFSMIELELDDKNRSFFLVCKEDNCTYEDKTIEFCDMDINNETYNVVIRKLKGGN